MTIFLTGAVRLVPQEEILREGQVYANNGWTLKDPTTHKVAITIKEQDIEALAQFLRNKKRDDKPSRWTDRNGNQREDQTVTLYLKGTEMAGNWVRLRAALNDGQQAAAGSAPRNRPSPPIRRGPGNPPPAPVQPSPAPAAAAATPALPLSDPFAAAPGSSTDASDDNAALPF